MRGGLVLWLVVAVLVVAHLLLHVGLGLGRAAPDLLTVALLVAARTLGLGAAAGLGFFFGLLEDAFSLLAFGANTLAMTLVGTVGALTRDLFVGDSLLFLVSYLFVGKWLRDVAHWVLAGEGLREPFAQTLLVQSPVAALYAAAAGVAALLASGALREPLR